MKYRFCPLILLSTLILNLYNAQGQTDISELISTRTADSISKNVFAKMVAGTDDVANLANYVSFVPSEGQFTLAGNYFIQIANKPTKKRRQEYFAVGFNGSGSIVGGTVATLFESGTLNTGVDLGLKLSWRINKPNIGSLGSESLEMIERRSSLELERTYKIDSTKNALNQTLLKLNQTELSITAAKIKLKQANEEVVRLNESLEICDSDTCRLRFTDSLLITKSNIFADEQKIIQLNNNALKLTEIYDVNRLDPSKNWEARTERENFLSTKYGISRINLSFQDTLINKIMKVYEDKIYEVEVARPIAGLKLYWLSAIINWNRVAYRTYYDTLSFESALSKIKQQGLTLGLQANFYTFYKPVRKVSLLNIAILYKKTNNLEDLTTSKLIEEETNVMGSTIRKSSNEYTVYTDPIASYKTIQVPINYYRYFGKDLNFGWHAYALADWRNTNDNLYDLGAGFIFGLNSAGSKRLFNVEVFTKYKDLTKEITEEDEKGWKQFQFGFSVAIPFMIYKN